MGIIIAKVSSYAEEYVLDWAKENNIDTDKALDEILTSIRDEKEDREEH